MVQVRAALALWRLTDGLVPPRAAAPALHVRAAQSRGAAEIIEATLFEAFRAAEIIKRRGTPASAGLAAVTLVSVPGTHLSVLRKSAEARRMLRIVEAFLHQHAPLPPRAEADKPKLLRSLLSCFGLTSRQ